MEHSPVETRLYALFRNAFALAAVALIIVRIVFLLSQLQNEDFLTRTLVRSCDVRTDIIYVIVQHAEDHYTLSPQDDAKLFYQVRIFESTPSLTGDVNSMNSGKQRPNR
ncbi:hypothetical protein FRC12_009489 [Ceratobasidium sp. 428]|nr:hypothetical protein FRC12_009489 [Ceratobasidium sp. 428]